MRWLIGAVLAGAVCGCTRDIDFRRADIQDGHLIIARPGSRILSERVRFDHRQVLCTEPSPDVAVALASSGHATISGGNGAASGSLGGGYSSSETVTALSGRSAGVVGLRDGLYFVCQAFANGVIGVGAYPLILSDYSQLLGTLVAGGDKAPEAASAPAPEAHPPTAAGGVTLTVVGGSMSTPAGAGAKPEPKPGGTATEAPKLPLRHPSLDSAMLLACINEFDPTRAYPDLKNTMLQGACPGFMARLMADASTAPASAGFDVAPPRARR